MRRQCRSRTATRSVIGKRAGVPRHPVDLLALTVVVEQRALKRYVEHLKRDGVPARTLEVLRAVSRDEGWHIDWVRDKGREIAEAEGTPERFERSTGALPRDRSRVWRSCRRSTTLGRPRSDHGISPGGSRRDHQSTGKPEGRRPPWRCCAVSLPNALSGSAQHWGRSYVRLGGRRVHDARVNLRIAFPEWSEAQAGAGS